MRLWRMPSSAAVFSNSVGKSRLLPEKRFVNSKPLSVWTHSVSYTHLETLARDLAVLAKDPYRVTAIQPVDMFPFTHHVETVVLMSRVKD